MEQRSGQPFHQPAVYAAPLGRRCPEQHGWQRAGRDNIFTERLWRTVKYEEVYPQGYDNPRTARQSLAAYFDFYHQQRFHQALNYRTPAAVYFGSPTDAQPTLAQDQSRANRCEPGAGQVGDCSPRSCPLVQRPYDDDGRNDRCQTILTAERRRYPNQDHFRVLTNPSTLGDGLLDWSLNSRLLDHMLEVSAQTSVVVTSQRTSSISSDFPSAASTSPTPLTFRVTTTWTALADEMLALQQELVAAEKWLDDARSDLSRRIARVDREIDGLVYELYGLTEEEIKIVEGRDA